MREDPAYSNMGLNTARVCYIGWDNLLPRGHQCLVSVRDVENYIAQHLHVFNNVKVCVLQVGTNDVHRSYHLNPAGLKDHVYRVAEQLRDAGVDRVAIMPMFFRQGAAALHPSDKGQSDPQVIRDAMGEFNEYVKDFNRMLLEDCRNGDSHIVLVQVHGLARQWGRHLADGLHFGDNGMKVYWRNVRRALILEGKKDN